MYSEEWGSNPRPQDRSTHFLTNCALIIPYYTLRVIMPLKYYTLLYLSSGFNPIVGINICIIFKKNLNMYVDTSKKKTEYFI